MTENYAPTQLQLFIKPVREYLLNGPIPPSDLAYLDLVQPYLEDVGSILGVHFMLETVGVEGAPDWWKGTVTEFEEEFHEEYQRCVRNLSQDTEFVWMAAEAEVQAKKLAPLPEDATREQAKDFVAQGRKRLQQTYAVELLLDMWVEGMGG